MYMYIYIYIVHSPAIVTKLKQPTARVSHLDPWWPRKTPGSYSTGAGEDEDLGGTASSRNWNARNGVLTTKTIWVKFEGECGHMLFTYYMLTIRHFIGGLGWHASFLTRNLPILWEMIPWFFMLMRSQGINMAISCFFHLYADAYSLFKPSFKVPWIEVFRSVKRNFQGLLLQG